MLQALRALLPILYVHIHGLRPQDGVQEDKEARRASQWAMPGTSWLELGNADRRQRFEGSHALAVGHAASLRYQKRSQSQPLVGTAGYALAKFALGVSGRNMSADGFGSDTLAITALNNGARPVNYSKISHADLILARKKAEEQGSEELLNIQSELDRRADTGTVITAPAGSVPERGHSETREHNQTVTIVSSENGLKVNPSKSDAQPPYSDLSMEELELQRKVAEDSSEAAKVHDIEAEIQKRISLRAKADHARLSPEELKQALKAASADKDMAQFESLKAELLKREGKTNFTHLSFDELKKALDSASDAEREELYKEQHKRLARHNSIQGKPSATAIFEKLQTERQKQLDAVDGAPMDDNPWSDLFGDSSEGRVVEDGGEVEQEVDDIVTDVEEIQRVVGKVTSKIRRFTREEGFRHVLLNLAVYSAALFISLGLYMMCFRHRDVQPGQEFRYGICECVGDSRICICGMCCPAIRWADTVSEGKGGFVVFSTALLVMTGLGMLSATPMLGIFFWIAIVTMGVYFRQQIRLKYGLETDTMLSYVEDISVWCCCTLCAICQEARQVDEEVEVDAQQSVMSREATWSA